MRKTVLGILTMLAIVLTACAAQKKKTTKPQLDYVQMWRTPCFGKCPNYKLEIYRNGLVRYTGIMFTDTGIYEKNIGEAAAEKVLRSFEKKRVDTLKKDYDVLISDLPGINFIFNYGKTTQNVRNAQFGPLYLRELADQFDLLINKRNGETPKMNADWQMISRSPLGG
ncbi:MAG: hypothetical protein JSS78_10845 [Bacteroidetes bacterium]|nr:hypothetical protein [Bacteroidota bacterium]